MLLFSSDRAGGSSPGVDGDGYVALTVEADYMTGMMPDGAVPFEYVTVALCDPESMTLEFNEELAH